MAAVTGAIGEIWGFSTPAGPVVDSSGNAVMQCFMNVTFTGTYAQADDGTIAGVPAAIQNARRDGKTVTVLSACGAGVGLEGTTPIGILANGVSHSSGTLTVQLTDGVLTAEHGNAALSAFTRPIPLCVNFKLS